MLYVEVMYYFNEQVNCIATHTQHLIPIDIKVLLESNIQDCYSVELDSAHIKTVHTCMYINQ